MSPFDSRRLVGLAPAIVAAVVLAAVPVPAAAAPRTYTVVIDKMKFGPVPANLHVGDVILWVNRDMFRHTATARDRSFDVQLAPSQSAKMVIRRSGAIAFSCAYHPGMTGRLVVARS